MKYPVRYYKEEDGWIAEVQAAGGGGFSTQGDSLEDAREMARDALTEVLLAQFEAGTVLTESPADLLDGYEWVRPFAPAWMSILICQQRKSSGLTLESAAELCGVSRGTYQRWEDPYKSNATLKTLERVAKAFGKQLEVALV